MAPGTIQASSFDRWLNLVEWDMCASKCSFHRVTFDEEMYSNMSSVFSLRQNVHKRTVLTSSDRRDAKRWTKTASNAPMAVGSIKSANWGEWAKNASPYLRIFDEWGRSPCDHPPPERRHGNSPLSPKTHVIKPTELSAQAHLHTSAPWAIVCFS